MMYLDVIINGEHLADMGLILMNKSLAAPEPEINTIKVPGRDGFLDFSEVVAGRVTYKSRVITMNFLCMNRNFAAAEALRSELVRKFHGKQARITFSDDAGFYWEGRIIIDGFTPKGKVNPAIIVTMTATVQPYKWHIETSDTDYEWDSFDFDSGIVNSLGLIDVDGEETVVFIGDQVNTTPIIVSSVGNMFLTVAFGGTIIVNRKELHSGENVINEWDANKPGEYTLIFEGSGNVSVISRGGSL